MTDNVKRAIERLDRFIAGAEGQERELDRGFIDSLITMVDMDSSLFPNRSLKILSDIDNRWDLLSYEGKIELTKRLRTALILNVEDNYIARAANEIEFLPYFDASEEDKSRLLDLCSGVRKIINASAAIAPEHKVRLLERMSAMEAEIYRDKSRIYVVLGVAEEISESLGRIGQNVRPLVARLEEISDIVRRLTSGWLGLPSEPRSQLPPPENTQDDEA